MSRPNFSALCITAIVFAVANFACGYSTFTISKIADTDTPIQAGRGLLRALTCPADSCLWAKGWRL